MFRKGDLVRFKPAPLRHHTRTDGVTFAIGYTLLGALFILVVAIASKLRPLPLSQTMIYLSAGVAIGPLGIGLLSLAPLSHSGLLERVAEIAVIVSLFTTGLKLRIPFRDPRWRVPLRLAFVSMTITVGLVAGAGVWLLGLPLGAAILLGAILAPTDPVLASDVQLANASDRDRVRFSLSGEAGLNDGTAFPFVMLGLGLLGVHEIGEWGWKWWTVDVLWAIGAGLGIGALLGTLTARLVLWLRRDRKEGVGRDEFLALGLISLAYGVALLAHSYGFLAVFAAGLALRTVERHHSGDSPPEDVLSVAAPNEEVEQIATDPKRAPAHMANAVLTFNEQIERVLEVAVVLLIGVSLLPFRIETEQIAFLVILFLAIRPLAVFGGVIGCGQTTNERRLLAWFGIRGIGSLYYLMYAVNHGLTTNLSQQLISITLAAIAISIIVHGITVTPLMRAYQSHRKRRV